MTYFNKKDELKNGYNTYIDSSIDDMGNVLEFISSAPWLLMQIKSERLSLLEMIVELQRLEQNLEIIG